MVERTGLENQRTERFRGFESHPIRQFEKKNMMPLNKKFPEASANTLYASSELIEKIIELDGGPDRKIFHNSLQ